MMSPPVSRRSVHLGSLLTLIAATLVASSCADGDAVSNTSGSATLVSGSTTTLGETTTTARGATVTFRADVWADNWFSLYVNGELVGEDSVPITTERSFNAESITFEAKYPLTVAMVTKDFRETDSGLEYIGTDRQQMGDGGFIAQFTDLSTGAIVATTTSDWRLLVIQRAPLNVECVDSSDPETECEFEAIDEPAGWIDSSFDDTGWAAPTVYTEDAVGAKDGYATVSWDPAAQLLWSSDLQVDNVILWRVTVSKN